MSLVGQTYWVQLAVPCRIACWVFVEILSLPHLWDVLGVDGSYRMSQRSCITLCESGAGG